MNFKLSIDKWNLVSEDGLPEDGEFCFLIWKSGDGEYDWGVGGYNESENEFYVNFGYGGLVFEAKDIVAWAILGEDETFTVQ